MSRGSPENLGPYRLLNVVITGQTSQVWEAIDTIKQQRVAIKLLLADFGRNREHVGYLKHEHAVGASLDHPRVIRIFEFGMTRTTAYLAMEYYAHPNMKLLIRRESQTLAYLTPKIIEGAAEGLSYLNAQGWIHRDIKPENYLVAPDGDVRLIDFALAERRKSGLARLFSRRSKIQGTRSYMSPEQIRGQALDQRSDLYSFGCTLYELLTGRPPYTGGSSNELLMKHLKAAPPSVDSANRNVTRELADLIRRTLAKKPAHRPASLDKFLQEFRTIRVFKEPPRPPAGTAAKQNAG